MIPMSDGAATFIRCAKTSMKYLLKLFFVLILGPLVIAGLVLFATVYGAFGGSKQHSRSA
jgi:hypothetical protein